MKTEVKESFVISNVLNYGWIVHRTTYIFSEQGEHIATIEIYNKLIMIRCLVWAFFIHVSGEALLPFLFFYSCPCLSLFRKMDWFTNMCYIYKEMQKAKNFCLFAKSIYKMNIPLHDNLLIWSLIQTWPTSMWSSVL